MKTTNRSKFHHSGYAALLTTISLSLTIMAFAITAFRTTRQSHTVQIRNQVKLDYHQKEQAFLRSLLHIVPNNAMQAMITNSGSNPNTLDWPAIFTQAVAQAQTDQALDPATFSDLNISVDVVSSNTGDANFDPRNFVTSPNSNGNFVLPDHDTNRLDLNGDLLDLPPRLRYFNGGNSFENTHPIINSNKRLTSTSPLFTEMPYPEIAFGYAAQGTTFLAKRNWWAFTVNFGAESAAITGIAPTPRTYVLSVYEVPSQLAISSSGSTTSIGKFDGGTDWDPDNISIAGTIYTDRAIIHDTASVGSVASRGGLTAPSGQSLGNLTERRELQATTNTFHRFSTSSESGLVSFTPINRGSDFFDYFAGTTSAQRTSGFYSNATGTSTGHDDYLSDNYNLNTVNDMSWEEYSVGARQTQIQVEVGATTGNAPSRLYISSRYGNDSQTRRQRCTRATTDGSGNFWRAPGITSVNRSGGAWPRSPEGDDWFIQNSTLPNGRPCLTLDLEKLPAFLTEVTADDVTINNSIWIGPNYGFSGVSPANYPSQDTDIALLIERSSDLSAYTNGLTLITPYRVYFTDDFNNTPISPAPAGATLDANGDWFPPASVYAPEKRFGIQNTSGNIQIAGQVGYLPSDTAPATVNPLDFKDGGTDTVTPSSIQANLTGISAETDLPPVSALSWLTTIEEIR